MPTISHLHQLQGAQHGRHQPFPERQKVSSFSSGERISDYQYRSYSFQENNKIFNERSPHNNNNDGTIKPTYSSIFTFSEQINNRVQKNIKLKQPQTQSIHKPTSIQLRETSCKYQIKKIKYIFLTVNKGSLTCLGLSDHIVAWVSNFLVTNK